MHVHVCMYVCACLNVYVYECIFLCMYIRVCMYVRVCMCVCCFSFPVVNLYQMPIVVGNMYLLPLSLQDLPRLSTYPA